MIVHRKSSAARKTARLTRSAFTLMEVLVVVAIIVVLAGVGTFYLLPRLGEAKDKVAQSNITKLDTACGTFKLNNDRWPQNLQELTARQPNGDAPLASTDEIKDPWGAEFKYDPSGPRNQGLKPDIWTVSQESSRKEIGNWPKGH
jgi:general secretion pathway protein G